ncbi:MAG TPA: biotin/lipoyl-binding protein [Tepidisphaeraceae bacterium]|jgi:RND family efflux transporter MFP subunit
MLKYILPAIAALGLLFGVYVVRSGAKPVAVSPPVAEPSRAPFAHYIAGAGIVESSTENIEISTPVPGMVTEIPVRVGQTVKAGDLLFAIDTRDMEAELKVRQAALELARAKLPEAEANLGDARRQLEFYKSVADVRAITQEELSKRSFAATAAESRLVQAKADVASAEAQVAQTQTEIDRRHVRAPVAGEVLQVKIHLGEYAQVGPLATPLIVLGDTKQVNVRTDIDENDAWRFHAGAAAVAYVRGNPRLYTKMNFVRVEPYVVPKKSLTGDTAERVDTRVLQVLYGFPHDALNVYVGQQMDVYIEVPGDRPTTGPASSAKASVATGKE